MKKVKKIKAIQTQKGTEWKTNSATKNTTQTQTVILVQNSYDSGHNYNEVIQKGDPWDDVSHCSSWQMATKNEGSEPGHIFQRKVFYQQPKLKFLIGLVHATNHTYKFFKKALIWL